MSTLTTMASYWGSVQFNVLEAVDTENIDELTVLATTYGVTMVVPYVHSANATLLKVEGRQVPPAILRWLDANK